MKSAIFKTFFLSLCIVANVHYAYATDQSILPPAKTTFVDQNGKPLTSGTVDFYTPSTSTRKVTYQDKAGTISNANPLTLDAAGRALIWGTGDYRQVVKDRNGNIIWDQVTSAAGSGGSTSTATGDGDLVGTIKPWAGMTAPNQYMFAYGQEISRTTYAALFTAITSSQSTFCTSGSPVLTGLSDTTNFWVGMSVEISCVASNASTIVSKTSTTVTMAANANVTVNTTARFFPWNRGNGITTFQLPDFRGFALIGNNNMGGSVSPTMTTAFYGVQDPNSSGATGGQQYTILTTPNLPPYIPSGTITNGAITNTVTGGTKGAVATTTAVAAAGHSFADVGSDIAVSSSQVASTFTGTAQGGSSTAFAIIQPSKTTNYIIKVTPDANSATASGVTSLGSMTGDIACGTGLLCTGNTIIANNTSAATITYTPPFTGGVVETQAAYNSQRVSVADFGASVLLANNSTAFQAANDAIAALGGGTVEIPTSVTSGNWALCSVVHISDNVTFLGKGPEATIIVPCANGQGIFDHIKGVSTSTPTNSRISNVGFNCQAYTGVIGFKSTLATDDSVDNANFIGCDTNIEVDRGTGFIINNIVSRGNAGQAAGRLKVWSSSDASYVYSPVIKNYKVDNIGNGLLYTHAIYLRRAVAGLIDGFVSNDLATKTGILIENDSQAVTVVNSYFTHPDIAVSLQIGAGVVVSPSFSNISNSFIDQSTLAAFSVGGATSWTTLDNNKITSSGVGTTTKCFDLSAGAIYTTISNNLCFGYFGVGGTFIALANGIDHLTVGASNVVTSTTNGMVFAGTSTNIRVFDNDLSGATNKTSGTITGTGNFFWNNLGMGGGTATTVLHGNATGDPSYSAVSLTTDATGTLQAAQEPAHTGDVTNSAGSLALAIANNAVTLGKLATQATNTVLGNATAGTAVPTALSMTSCSTSASAVIWTTNTGFGCNTSINAATLGGATFSAPGAIGGGTSSTGAFTSITGTSTVITNGTGATAISASTAGGYQYQLIHPTFPRTYGFAINGSNGGWTFDDVTGGASRLFINVSGGIGIGVTSTDPGNGSLIIAGVYKSSIGATAVSGAGPFAIGSGSTLNFRMKVTLNGTDYWIPVSTTAF